MSIRDFFKNVFQVLLCLCSVVIMSAQELGEDLKFGRSSLDTALKVVAVDRINTKGLEFSPTFYKDGIVYVTAKESHKLDYLEGLSFFSLKYAPLNDAGLPIAPVPFFIDEHKKDHKGPVAFDEERDLMFVSRTQLEDRSAYFEEGEAKMHIYQLSRGDTFWVEPVHLPFNDRSSNSFHPTLSSDGNLLIFSSDRGEDGQGFDLYAVQKVRGKWSEAYSLGEEVNSNGDEAFPYLYKDKYLFFSSDRKGGMGDEDIYLSVLEDDRWGAPVNIGRPFNSEDADLGIIFQDNGKTGFFSSNRNGQDDIFAFFSDVHLFLEEPKPKDLVLQFQDGESGMRIEQVKAWMFELDENGNIIDREAYRSKIVEKPGNKGLTIEVERKGGKELDSTSVISNRNGIAKVRLEPGKQYQLIAYHPNFQEFETVLDYSEIDSSLTLNLEELNCIPLELQAVGPGGKEMESFEVRIKELSGKEFLDFSMPYNEEICIRESKSYRITGHRKGYISDTFALAPQSGDVKKVSVIFRLIPDPNSPVSLTSSSGDDIGKGAVIELSNIYYDYNKSSIRVGAEKDLDALADIMKDYPTMRIELSAHTDSRGSSLYNLRLSYRRAASAKEYLENKGIDEDRIRAIGYGESKIRNKCVNGVKCTDKEHEANRRTEIKITHMEKEVEVNYKEEPPQK